MKECLLNFVQDLFKFPWTREEFLSCNSFRESYDTFHDRIGDCSFDEYVEFFKEFNLECSALEKSIGELSDKQLEQVSGGGIGRFIPIPMVALTLLSGVSGVTGFAASINAPAAVSAQATVHDEWEKTRSFVARAGDPWLSMLPVEGEDGFDEYKKPEVEIYKNGKEVVLGEDQKDGSSRNDVYPQIYEIVQNFMDYTDERKVREELPEGLRKVVDAADNDMGNASKEEGLPRDLKIAKYIYVWIAKNIKYDDALSARKDGDERDYRAEPGVVFERKDGVCAGFAELARLMMRIAKIPCVYVGSPFDKSAGGAHGFNAIYIEKFNKNGDREKGWTIMDATWGMQKDRLDAETNEKKLHDNFPAAYDNESLKGNNISVMHDMSHQVRDIEGDNSYILNGVKYTVDNDGILVTSDLGDPVSLQIPPEILALGRKIKIGKGIKKYKCSSDEETDISDAQDLTGINADNSRRYKFRDGVLRDNYNGKVEILHEIDENVNYTLKDNYIYVSANSENPVSLKIPKGILDLGLKIEIGLGIKEYIYTDDEEIDISGATNLQSIKTPENGKYKFKDGVLYGNDGNESKKAVGILPNTVIDGFCYTLSGSTVTVSGDYYGGPRTLEIPEPILKLNKKIQIGFGIEEYVCSGDEEIDISNAWNLKKINTSNSKVSNDKNAPQKYTFGDGVLYEKGKAVGILPEIDGVRYSLSDSTITVSGDSYRGPQALQIPPEILRLNRKIIIGEGITNYKFSGNEEIDISEAENLESIDGISPGGRYSKFADGILYEQNKATGEEKAVGISPINGFHYSLSGDSINVSKDTGGTFDLKIPQSILALKRRIVIGEGIENYECSGGEEIDISGAKDLESITNLPEGYSKFEGGVLYKKGEEVADLKPGASVDIDEVTYCRESKDAIRIFSAQGTHYFVTPPPEILALNNKIVIGEGITRYKCSKTEEIDIVDAENLIRINTRDSERYSKFEDGILYYKEGYKDGEKVAYLAPGKHVNINKVDYFRDADNSIQISSTDLKTDPTLIPKSILNQRQKENKKSKLVSFYDEYLERGGPKVKIRNGIEHYVCSGNEEIDISEAKDLKLIDISKSERYVLIDQILYEKGERGRKKAVAVLPIIGEFNYSLRENGSIHVSSASKNSNNLKIPESILRLHRRIVLGPGIKEYKCSGNEEIDISEAKDLESITNLPEGYSKFESGVLYKKDGSVADLKPGASVVVDKVKYYRDQKDFHFITVSAADLSSPVTLTSTLPILDLGHRIVIGEGIEAYKSYGSEEIYISEAYNLQFIDLTISSVYSDFSKDVLYKKDGSVADLKPGVSAERDKVKYYRDFNNCHSVTISCKDTAPHSLQPLPGLALNSKIKIGEGIRTYTCSGNEEIDISGAKNLIFVDTKNSERYNKCELGVLYYRKDGSVADISPGSDVNIGEFNYRRRHDDCNSIYVACRHYDSNKVTTLTPPAEILNLKCKIKIESGINIYKYSGDEEVDISGAYNLTSIDTSESRKFEYKDYILYEKDEVGNYCKVVGIMRSIGDFYYSLKEDGSIDVSGPNEPILRIPPSILNLKKKIVIGMGIRRYECSLYAGEVDISEATDLKLISTPELGWCSVEGGILYKDDENGNKRAVGFWPKIDGVTYSVGSDNISVVSDSKKPVDLKIKKEILDMHKDKKIKIGEGIEEYQCSGNEEIDISQAKDLQSITGYSERYDKFEYGKLYDKNGRVVGERL